jgi:hypothetical protein
MQKRGVRITEKMLSLELRASSLVDTVPTSRVPAVAETVLGKEADKGAERIHLLLPLIRSEAGSKKHAADPSAPRRAIMPAGVSS